ncbi:hypothetical protein M422DRAFT_277384, partial [Sphaerobolus stellatus SS14]
YASFGRRNGNRAVPPVSALNVPAQGRGRSSSRAPSVVPAPAPRASSRAPSIQQQPPRRSSPNPSVRPSIRDEERPLPAPPSSRRKWSFGRNRGNVAVSALDRERDRGRAGSTARVAPQVRAPSVQPQPQAQRQPSPQPQPLRRQPSPQPARQPSPRPSLRPTVSRDRDERPLPPAPANNNNKRRFIPNLNLGTRYGSFGRSAQPPQQPQPIPITRQRTPSRARPTPITSIPTPIRVQAQPIPSPTQSRRSFVIPQGSHLPKKKEKTYFMGRFLPSFAKGRKEGVEAEWTVWQRGGPGAGAGKGEGERKRKRKRQG